MNGKNLNVRYRRNAYAKTRVKVIAAIFGAVAALLVISFLVVGVALKDKVDNDRVNENTNQPQSTDTIVPHVIVPSVKGYGMTLAGATATTASDKATEVSKAGGSNVSFVVRDTSGKELYKSALAQSMGKQTAGNQIDITDIESKASVKGLSSSAIVPIYSFAKKDKIERAAQLFYDAAICAESFIEGADDVLIKLEGTNVTESNLEEVLRLAEWVKDLDEKAVIGIAITKDVLSGANAEVIVGKLWEKYDFLALDLTTLKTGESISQSGSNEMQFYLLMYKMRVLLPNFTGDDLKKAVSEIESMNVDNWQTVVQ